MKKSSYRSEIARSVHESVSEFYRAGRTGMVTMRQFDRSCLTPLEELSPESIRALRKRENVSQAAFAESLSVSLSLVSQWERGKKKPSGPSLKLLNLVKQKGLKYIQP